jgi:hypothetical protein
MDALILETDGGVNTQDGGQLTVGLLQIVMDAEEAGQVGGGFIRIKNKIKYKCIIYIIIYNQTCIFENP